MAYIVEIRKRDELPKTFFEKSHPEIELAFNAIENKSGKYETTNDVVEEIFVPADSAINHIRMPFQERPFLKLSAYLEKPNLRQDVNIGYVYMTHSTLSNEPRKIENNIPKILASKVSLNYGRVHEEEINRWLIHIFDSDMYVHWLGDLRVE